jgi:Tfp pilus assembly protein PilF
MATERPRGRILGMTEWAEKLPITLGKWLLVLAAIIVLRHFLEQVSGEKKTLYFLSYFIHYPLAYVAPLLALSVVLSAFARERIERVTKLMLFAWLLTLLPPLLDILLHRTSEEPELIGYLIPLGSTTLGSAFLNLLNPAYDSFQGTTAGIRIEAALGCVLGGYYVYLKTRSPLRTILSVFVVYATMFFFFALPSISLAVARLLGAEVDNVFVFLFSKARVHRAFVNATPFGVSDLSNALIDMIVIVPVLAVWHRLYDPAKWRDLVRSIDPIQTGAHVFATLIGAVLGARLLLGSEGLLSISHPFDVISIVGILTASFFAAMTAGVMRELHAERSQELSAPRTDELRRRAAFYVSFACLFALSVSYVALTYVLGTLAAYYLYYAAPFRLSRFPLLSGFVVGGALLFSLSLGFAAYAGASASLWLPAGVGLTCLFSPALGMAARDVWSGASGRYSLGALLPGRNERVAAGCAVLAACLLPAALLANPRLLIPGAVAGAAGLVLVVRARRSVLPQGLAILSAFLVIAAFLMGAADSAVLRRQLETTLFAEAVRKEGSFQMLDPRTTTDRDVLMREGLELFHQTDYEGAARNFRRALEMDPDDVTALLSVGSTYMRLERISEAARTFRRAIDIEPGNATAHVGLGQTYLLYDDLGAAEEELTLAFDLDPRNADAAFTLARVFQMMGDVERETDALRKTVEIDAANSAAHSRLADIYLERNLYADAITALRDAMAGRGPVERARARLARAHYSLGDLEAAERVIREEIAVDPKTLSLRSVLARLLAEQGRASEAAAELREAISLTSDARLRERFERELNDIEGR